MLGVLDVPVDFCVGHSPASGIIRLQHVWLQAGLSLQ
jgi:hypothetical protein